MYRTRATLLALLTFASFAWSPYAAADRGDGRRDDQRRHEQRYDQRNDQRNDYRHDHRPPPRHHGGHRDNDALVVGTGLALGAGLLWLATREPQPPSPPPVYMSVPEPRPPAVWYYCRSAGAYFPYVKSCRAPWELVPAY